jgi:hypothetical protein
VVVIIAEIARDHHHRRRLRRRHHLFNGSKRLHRTSSIRIRLLPSFARR